MPRVHRYVGVRRFQLPRMRGQVRVAEVADEDGARAVLGKLVCGGAPDADGGVRAWGRMGVLGFGGKVKRGGGWGGTGYDDDFVFDSSVGGVLVEEDLRVWKGRGVLPCRIAGDVLDWGNCGEGTGVGGGDRELLR